MLVGNDIVDLNDILNQTQCRDKRWMRKVFSEEEIFVIENSQYPLLKFWKFWAMKETGYKIFMKMGYRPFMNFINIRIGEKEDVVFYKNEQIHCKIKTDKNILFCTGVSTTDIKYNSGYQVLESHDNIYKTAMEFIAKRENIRVDIIHDTNGMPFVNVKNMDISFSHDGKYSSFYYTIQC